MEATTKSPPQICCMAYLIEFFFCTKTAGKIIVLCHHCTAHLNISAWISAVLKMQIAIKVKNATTRNQESWCNKKKVDFPAWKLFPGERRGHASPRVLTGQERLYLQGCIKKSVVRIYSLLELCLPLVCPPPTYIGI